jgi:LysR family transcriptional regulator for bpeEF and oprC
MESFDEIVAFTRVVEAKSFAGGANSLGITPSAVSKAVSRLEQRLGAKLLHRTTRSLNLTDAGAAFYARCVDVMRRLAEAECEIACMLGRPAGRLRVGMPVTMSRAMFAPALPKFLARYPDLQVQIHTSDRIVDLVEEGLDLVLRVGELEDSSLHARRVGGLPALTCASPEFLARHGTPATPQALDPQYCLALVNPNTGQVRSWTFDRGGTTYRLDPASRATFTDTESVVAAAIGGLGFARVLRMTAEAAMADGRLVPVLPDWNHGLRPVSAVYVRDRNPLAKVRAFIDFAIEMFGGEVERASPPQGARRASTGSGVSQPAPSAL